MSVFRKAIVALLATAFIGGGVMAQTGASLTDGTAIFDAGNNAGSGGNLPTTSTSGASAISADFRLNGEASADNTFTTWWWYRVAGDTRERNFNYTAGRHTRTLTGANQVDFGFTNLTSNGTNILDGISANMMYRVNSNGVNAANVWSQLAITNSSSTELTIDLYFYNDIFLGNQDAGDFSDPLVIDGSGQRFHNFRDTTSTGAQPTWFHQLRGYDAVGSAMGTFGVVGGQMGDSSVDNFVPDVGAGGAPAADNSQVMQYRYVIPAGGVVWANAAMCVANNIPVGQNVAGAVFCNAVPEPTTMALLAVAGLFAARRRAAR